MRLTNVAIKQATAQDKPYKLYDGKGLYCLVHPNGGRYWRYDYRFQYKRKTIPIGTYPRVSLRKARIIHDTMQRQLYEKIDPAAKRKAAKNKLKKIKIDLICVQVKIPLWLKSTLIF